MTLRLPLIVASALFWTATFTHPVLLVWAAAASLGMVLTARRLAR